MADSTEAIKKHARRVFEKKPGSDETFESFLLKLAQSGSSAPLPVDLDTSHPLSHYFISSSHNTYLSGNQLWGKSTADAYKDVLRRGCRCIEIDIWDGGSPPSSSAEDSHNSEDHDAKKLSGLLRKGLGRLRSKSNAKEPVADSSPAEDIVMPTPWRTESGRDEPVVYHGYTATHEMSFRKVCEVVRDNAFKTSDLPVIVSLEIHCSPDQQEFVAELMHDYWGSYLVRVPEGFSDSTPLPPLSTLKKKILVKVKWSPPRNKAKSGEATKQSVKGSDDENASGDAGNVLKKAKIVESLSNMGIFTRAFHFSNLAQPEATIPTHVFSLSENKLLDICKEEPEALLQHNLNYLMRAYPKGSRVRSSNLDPAPLWRFGISMVALNFQTLNAATMLNTAQFEGTGGYMLKPKGYVPTNGKQPQPERITFDLSLRIFAAQALGPNHDVPHAYVKCELHVESPAEAEASQIPNGAKTKGGEWKRRSGVKHSRDADWGGEELRFEGVKHVVPELSFLRLKVMDDALAQKDRLLGWACYRLDRLPQGLMLVHLRGEDFKPGSSSLLLEVHTTMHP